MTAEAQLDRHSVTFAQAEGAVPLPAPLKPKELSLELRNRLWVTLYSKLKENSRTSSAFYGRRLVEPWSNYMMAVHVVHFVKPIDEFSADFDEWVEVLKKIIFNGDYVDVLGLLQFMVRLHGPTDNFVGAVDAALKYFKAAYTLVDGRTFFPVASSEEGEAVIRALDALARAEYGGARAHLMKAGELFNAGDNAGAVRESIHAVEALARSMEPTATTLGPALTKLEKAGKLHPALKSAFSSLYGYTSDEEGVRHALVEKEAPAVEPAEALFMIGACASFTTYLIGKGQAAGILK